MSILFTIANSSQETKIKALVGGTLIDGFGTTPIKNSVVIIEGEKIKTIATVDTIEIPASAEVSAISKCISD